MCHQMGQASQSHDGLAQGVLQLGLGQGVAEISESPSTLNSLHQVHRSLKALCQLYTIQPNLTTTHFARGVGVEFVWSSPCFVPTPRQTGLPGKNTNLTKPTTSGQLLRIIPSTSASKPPGPKHELARWFLNLVWRV